MDTKTQEKPFTSINELVITLTRVAAEPGAYKEHQVTCESKQVVIDRIDTQIVHYLSVIQSKINEIAGIMSEQWGDGAYRGENPPIDRMFDLIDDLTETEGKDRCDYFD